MKKSELQEQIEAYLNHSMSAEDLALWEQRMADDPDLRREVALHRQMHQDFDAGRLRLRASLQDIMQEPLPPAIPDAPQPKRPWWLWIGLLGVLLVAVWSVVLWKKPAPATPVSVPAPQAPAPISPPDTTQTAPPTVSRPPMAMADPARFKTNLSMEALVKSKVRSESIAVDMVRPVNNFRAIQDNDKGALLRFTGTVQAGDDQLLNTLVVSVFDNTNAATPVLELPVAGSGGANRSFDIKKRLDLLPGLYYYTIEEVDKGEVLYAGKFFIITR